MLEYKPITTEQNEANLIALLSENQEEEKRFQQKKIQIFH